MTQPVCALPQRNCEPKLGPLVSLSSVILNNVYFLLYLSLYFSVYSQEQIFHNQENFL